MLSQEKAASRENAQIFTGNEICQKKSIEILEKFNLPKGLLPLDNMVELGYNAETGFWWVKQNTSKTHLNTKIDRSIWYDTEVTSFVQDRRMKHVKGVKSQELLIWFTVNDISVEDSASGKITFGTSTGISRSFPATAFELN